MCAAGSCRMAHLRPSSFSGSTLNLCPPEACGETAYPSRESQRPPHANSRLAIALRPRNLWLEFGRPKYQDGRCGHAALASSDLDDEPILGMAKYGSYVEGPGQGVGSCHLFSVRKPCPRLAGGPPRPGWFSRPAEAWLVLARSRLQRGLGTACVRRRRRHPGDNPMKAKCIVPGRACFVLNCAKKLATFPLC